MHKIKLIIIVFITAFSISTSVAQEKFETHADSLNSVYHKYLDSNNYSFAFKSLRKEAIYYLENGDIDRSRTVMDSAFSILPADADTLNYYYSLCLEIRAISFAYQGDYSNMENGFKRVLNHLNSYDSDSVLLAKAYRNLALYYFNNHEYTGVQYFNKSTEINRKLKDWGGLINNYNAFCTYLASQEYNDLANKYIDYCESVYLENDLNDIILLAGLYQMRGINYTHQGKYDKSYYWVKKAYDIIIENNLINRAIVYYSGNVALEAIELKNYSEAKKYSVLSINYAKQYYQPSSDMMGNLYLTLGQSMVKLNELDSADYYLDKCIDIYLKNNGNNYHYLSIPYHAKAEAANMRNQPLKAAMLFQKSIYTNMELMNSIDSTLMTAPSVKNYKKGIDLIKFALLNKSEALYQYSLNNNDDRYEKTIIDHLAKLDTLEWQYTNNVSLSIEDNIRQFNEFKKTLNLMAKISSKNKSAEYLQYYFNMLDNQKAGYLDANIRLNENNSQVNDTLRKLGIEIASFEKKYNYYESEESALKTKTLDTLCNLYLNKLEINNNNNSDNGNTNSDLEHRMSQLSISEVQRYTKKNNVVIIDYFFHENKLYSLAISSNKAILKSIDIDEKFNDKINKYNRAIKTQNAAKYKIGKELSDILIMPILSEINDIDGFVILPYGKLAEIPFDLLPINDDGKMLIESYDISYHYSTKLWVKSMKYNPNQQASLLAIAPVFRKSDINISDYNDLSQLDINSENVVTRSGDLKALPYSEKEVKKIKNIFKEKGYSTSLLLNDKATIQNFNSQSSGKSIIHIATHGISSKRSVYNTGLFFYFNDEKNKERAFLSVSDLSFSKLNADLVVLSACKTASGQIVDGEGAIALPRAFYKSGVSNVISSLWKVNDKNTQYLMTQFYGYLVEGNTYRKSLQKAKLDCLHKGYSELDWAGFMLIGR